MLINYELLRTFIAVAGAPTFAEAARRRNVTPSAVSQQMSALEVQLGVGLFERVGRRAMLTEAGAQLAAVLRERFADIEEALELVVRDASGIRGRVRLGAPRPFFAHWMQPRLSALLCSHPELELEVRFDGPSALGRMLLAGELDLAVLVEPFVEPSLTSALLYVEELVAVAPAGHANREDIEALRWIVFDDDLPMHAPFWRATFGVKAPLPPKIVARVASLDAMLAMVIAGVGAAVLPGYLVESAIAAGQVSRLGIAAPRPVENPIHLAWRAAGLDTARRRAVREALHAPPSQSRTR